jgi:hypothetical protein
MPNNDLMNQLAMLESNRPQGTIGGGQPQQAPQQQFGPQEMLQSLNRTPMGHPSYSTNRMLPNGQGGGVNPLTGKPYASYQEFMATRSPEVFAGSRTGQGLQPGPAPPQVQGQQPGDMPGYAALVQRFLSGGG